MKENQSPKKNTPSKGADYKQISIYNYVNPGEGRNRDRKTTDDISSERDKKKHGNEGLPMLKKIEKKGGARRAEKQTILRKTIQDLGIKKGARLAMQIEIDERTKAEDLGKKMG